MDPPPETLERLSSRFFAQVAVVVEPGPDIADQLFLDPVKARFRSPHVDHPFQAADNGMIIIASLCFELKDFL